MATANNGSKWQTASVIKNLEILGNILKKLILIAMDEVEEELPTMWDVNEAVRTFYCHKRAWTVMSQYTSTIKERMMALEEVVKKEVADPAKKSAPVVLSGVPTHVSHVAHSFAIDENGCTN